MIILRSLSKYHEVKHILTSLINLPTFRLKNAKKKLYYSTIYALSSGQGKCGVAVIRISGNQAHQSLLKMTSPQNLPAPRKAVLRHICHPETGERLDKGLVLWFPRPRSFTGENSVEFHIHGGPAVIKAVLSALGTLPDFAPAKPGDYTKRAFYNSKLDLTKVEGLGDLIHAETEAQRRQALRQMEGALSEMYSQWRTTILKCRANLEAYIDFSEDENLEQGVLLDVKQDLESLIKKISGHLSDSRRGERLKSGLNLVILGRPNVGKSSFLNVVVQRPAAIVSPIAGTTRDVMEISLDLGGYPINISDTAGLRGTEDIIEIEGVKRALQKVEDADIALIIVESSEVLNYIKGNEPCTLKAIKETECRTLNSRRKSEYSTLCTVEESNSSTTLNTVEENKTSALNVFLTKYFNEVGIFTQSDSIESTSDKYRWLEGSKYLVFMNKIDLIENKNDIELLKQFITSKNFCLASLKSHVGLDEALGKVKDLSSSICGSGSAAESPYLTSARQRTHIENCLKHLCIVMYNSNDNFSLSTPTNVSHLMELINDCDISNHKHTCGLLHSEETLLFAAQQLSLAATQLGHVAGHITTEDILDHIFSSFCIGK